MAVSDAKTVECHNCGHQYEVPTVIGEDDYVTCDNCQIEYTATPPSAAEQAKAAAKKKAMATAKKDVRKALRKGVKGTGVKFR